MLKFMRRGANTFVVKLLLFFIALSFMVWGVGDYVNQQDQEPIAQAKRWSITPREFAVAYDNEFQRMRQRFGGSLDKKTAEVLGLKQKTLNAMINRHLILDKSRDLRLTVSAHSLRETIATTPVFQKDGSFDLERYELVLRNNRMSPRDYEQKLKTDLVATQMQQSVGTILHIPNLLVEDMYSLENEKRTVEVMSLPFEQLVASIQPTDDELTAFLKKNHEHYVSPVQVKINYVLLSPDSVREAVSVTDAEIDEYYAEHKDEYRQEEKRQARHILFKTSESVTAAQAMEKANTAKTRIDKGEPFETVARELSEDVSAAQGGDLGLFGRGVMVKEFEDVAFSLEPETISPPVQTPFGVHLIRVDKIHPAETRPFESVKVEIKGVLTEKKAMDMVYERSVVLEDQVFSSGDLKTISGDLNLRYKEMDFFQRTDAAKLDSIEKDSKFLDSAFGTPKGELSPVVELSNGRFFVIRVTDRKESQSQPLNNVKDQVTKDYKKEKSVEMAREHLGRILKDLAQGTPWDKAASSHPAIKTTAVEPFVRAGKGDQINPAIRAASFKLTLENPVHTQIIENNDSLAIIRLLGVEKADPANLVDKERKELSSKFKSDLGLEQLTAYLDGLWNAAGIRINYKAMERF